MKKVLSLIGIAIALALTLSGCGPNWNKNNYYRPAAFGENSECYYMQTSAEAQMLIQQGLCDPTWVPTQAPNYWQERYFDYYSSSEYSNYYVPASQRRIYMVYTNDFGRTWASQIRTQRANAVYVDNKGDKANGNTVPKTMFGGGVRSKGGQGIRGANGKSVKSNTDKWYKQQKSSSSNTGSNSGKSSSWGKSSGTKSGSKSSGGIRRR